MHYLLIETKEIVSELKSFFLELATCEGHCIQFVFNGLLLENQNGDTLAIQSSLDISDFMDRCSDDDMSSTTSNQWHADVFGVVTPGDASKICVSLLLPNV